MSLSVEGESFVMARGGGGATIYLGVIIYNIMSYRIADRARNEILAAVY